jgi:hypothetical protein
MTGQPVPSKDPPAGRAWTAGLSDADLRNTMLAALRLLAILAVFAGALFWWKAGWQSAVLVAVGAAISAASLWEWMRLTFGFFLRIGVTLAVLYGSLKYLHGTVFALAVGLGLGIVSLTVEALRILKRWTE